MRRSGLPAHTGGQRRGVIQCAPLQIADGAVGIADTDQEARGVAAGHRIDQQRLRHAEYRRKKRVAVKYIEDRTALRRRCTDTGRLNAIAAAGMLRMDLRFLRLQQAGVLPFGNTGGHDVSGFRRPI